MPISFRCPSCRECLTIPDASAGEWTQCIGCGKRLRVSRQPKSDAGIMSLPALPASKVASASTASAPTSSIPHPEFDFDAPVPLPVPPVPPPVPTELLVDDHAGPPPSSPPPSVPQPVMAAQLVDDQGDGHDNHDDEPARRSHRNGNGRRNSRRNGHGAPEHAGQKLGTLLMGFGVAGLLYFFNMDTTVATPGLGFGIDRVHNIGLLHQRQMGLLLSGGAAGVGAICYVIATAKGNRQLDSRPR